MGRLGPCMVAPVPIQRMNVCEWMNVTRNVQRDLSGRKTRKALYKYSLFTIYHNKQWNWYQFFFSDYCVELNITLNHKSSHFHSCHFCFLVTLMQAWQHLMAALALEACLMAQEAPWRHWARPTQASSSMLLLPSLACTTRACCPSKVSQLQAAKKKVGAVDWVWKEGDDMVGGRKYRWNDQWI